MCGIICEICFSGHCLEDDKLLQSIKNRGPDCIQNTEVILENGSKISFFGSVLWMQGPNPTPQPMENNMGILLYNGDIFDETWSKDISDTQLIMGKLSNASRDSLGKKLIEEVKLFKGPFCIVYFDKISQNLYFARDRIGRSSMLFHHSENKIIISSVLDRKYECIEVPAIHIYKLNLHTLTLELHSWNEMTAVEEYVLAEWLKLIKHQQSLPDDEFSFNFDPLNLIEKDDTVSYIDTIARNEKCKQAIMEHLLKHKVLKETVIKLTHLLENSVRIRLKTQPQKCKECIKTTVQSCNHCTVGILFSGGLDCTVIAYLVDKYLPVQQSIDLMNVAFKKNIHGTYEVPDRITGRQSFEELKKLCPSRQWVFREINVTKEELEQFQASTIADLVYPRQTILDESLGTALWFAAKGKDSSNVTSSCRVLLLGSGADELFGGYTRHRNAYKRNKWFGLSKELALDWKRISFRNLARDNRVICDHGRQPRMPYLDEDFTEYVLHLKPWLKCFPSENLGLGIGDKLMLRLISFNLGLSNVATFPKRALQFGSRIANKNEKGSDLSKTFSDK